MQEKKTIYGQKITSLEAKAIAEKFKKITNTNSYKELGAILGGISSAAISKAIAKGKIPGRWFEIIEERYGVPKESLVKAIEPCSAEKVFLPEEELLKKQVDLEELLSVYRQLNETRRELDEVRVELNDVRIENAELIKKVNQLELERAQKGKKAARAQCSSGVHTSTPAAHSSPKEAK